MATNFLADSSAPVKATSRSTAEAKFQAPNTVPAKEASTALAKPVVAKITEEAVALTTNPGVVIRMELD